MTRGDVSFIYATVAVLTLLVESHPSTPYTGTEVMRRALFWPLYVVSWLVHNLVKAFAEAWSGR